MNDEQAYVITSAQPDDPLMFLNVVVLGEDALKRELEITKDRNFDVRKLDT